MLRSGTWSLKEEKAHGQQGRKYLQWSLKNVIDWPHQHLGHKLVLQFLYQFQFSITQSSCVMKESSTVQDLNFLVSTRLAVFPPAWIPWVKGCITLEHRKDWTVISFVHFITFKSSVKAYTQCQCWQSVNLVYIFSTVPLCCYT